MLNSTSKTFKVSLLAILFLPGFVYAQSSSGITAWCHDFNVNLVIGKKGPEVTALQIALNKEGIFEAAYLGGNYFGKITRYAVIKFQEKYIDEILLPAGLTKGNGFVGPLTRSKLNELYGCSNVAPSTPAPAPAPAPTPTPTPAQPPAPATAPTPVPPAVTPAPPPATPPSASVFLDVVEADESTYTDPQYSFFLDTLNAKFSASGGTAAINKMVLASDDPHADQDIMFIDVERMINGGLPKIYQATSSPHYFQPPGAILGYWLWDVNLTPPRTATEVWGWNWYFGAASTSSLPATSLYITPQVVLEGSNKVIRIIPYCAHYAEFRVGIMSVDAVIVNSSTPVTVSGLPASTPLFGHKVGCYPPDSHPPQQPPPPPPPPSPSR